MNMQRKNCKNLAATRGVENAVFARRRLELAALGSVDARDAAAFLGVSNKTIYKLRQAGVLSSAVIGGKIVFPVKALQGYLASMIQFGDVA
jgi:excisionase family DNA binding protein